ncbi:universal stress protein [Prauserella cavernicola]|uniref:Universal stress protein n=1 Tax=Prauserella cavernicola TaxID=2800127 RepID=A0A934QPF1_9PSEU|nr:universal stress protein [Prauserella cavernicola]MBK1783960.1 universal stress protein [Prauserella cavernicola]
MSIVVFATDSAAGAAALDWAMDHRADGEHLHVVLSRSDVPSRPGHASWARTDEFTATLQARAIEYSTYRGDDDPADRALRLVEDTDARLLVVGIRKRTATAKMILGSNAHHLLGDATCPVVCVKP